MANSKDGQSHKDEYIDNNRKKKIMLMCNVNSKIQNLKVMINVNFLQRGAWPHTNKQNYDYTITLLCAKFR